MQPTMVYKLGGPHRGPKGTTYDYLGVSTEIELAKALAAGYYKTLDEAVDPPKEEKLPEYKVGLEGSENIKTPPQPVKNLDGEDITLGALGELTPKMKRGRPKKKKEIFGDDE